MYLYNNGTETSPFGNKYGELWGQQRSLALFYHAEFYNPGNTLFEMTLFSGLEIEEKDHIDFWESWSRLTHRQDIENGENFRLL